MTLMTADQTTSLDQHLLTFMLNDAIHAEADGTMNRAQAELLDLLDSPVVDRLAEDEMGIFTDEDARDDLCHHGLSDLLCMDPIGQYHFGTYEWERTMYPW